VAELWDEIESDPVYAGKTDLIVTNDHGRHDDAHGGFQGHGCGCDGCRHIMFLGLGPDFRQNYISYEYGRIPDIVPTMAEIMGFFPEYCTGEALFDVLRDPLLCGDAQDDGSRTTADGYFILNYLGAGPQPASCWSANVNGDGGLTSGDGFHLLNFFGSGPALDCGPCEF
jgi:hypothetical protein